MDKLIKDNPLTTVKTPKLGKRLPKILSEDELTRVLKAATKDDWPSSRDRVLVELLLDTGMTLQEVVDLKVTDADLEGGITKVYRQKTSKERYVHLSKRRKELE